MLEQLKFAPAPAVIQSKSEQAVDTSINERNVVRVFPQSLAKPTDTFAIFDYLYNGDILTHLPDLWFTHSTWIVKDLGTKSPGQIMMPGGKIKQKEQANGELEDIYSAAEKEIWRDLHVPHTKGDEKIIASRQYQFDNGKEKRDEIILSGKIPSFITPTSIHVKDKIAHIPQLNPAEVESLVTSESFRGAPLLESLREELLPGVRVEPDLANEELKDQTLIEAYNYELNVRKKVMDRFLCKYYPDPGCMQIIRDQLGEELGQLGDPRQDDTVELLKKKINTLNNFFTTYVQADLNLPLDQVRDTLQVSNEEIYLEECVELIKDTGPQAPYLVSQILLEFSRITPKELEVIKSIAPETYALHNSVRQAYADNPTSDNWYLDAQQTIARMRDIKAKADWDRTEQEDSEYKTRTEAFISGYLNALGMHNEGEHTHYMEDMHSFLKYVQGFITKHVDSQTAARVFSDPLLSRTSSPEELMFVRYGFLQYGKSKRNGHSGMTDIDMSKAYNRVVPWQIERKLIGTSQMPKLEKIHGQLASRRIYRTRQSVHSVLEDYVNVTTTGPFESYESRLSTSQTAVFEHKGKVAKVNLDQVAIDYYVGDKDKNSTYRKWLERCELNEKDGTTDIEDIQRWSFRAKAGKETVNNGEQTITEQLMTQGFTQEEVQELLPQIGRETIKQFMVELLSDLQDKSKLITLRYIKMSQTMEGVIDEIKMAMLARFGKVRVDEKINFQNGHHVGSGSSLEHKPWSWLKFVLDVDGLPSEFQIFPTEEDYKTKVNDDKRYEGQRFVDIHIGDRFPLSTTLFKAEEHIEEKLVKNGNGIRH